MSVEYDAYRQAQIANAAVYQDFVSMCFLDILKMPISVYSSKLFQQEIGESATGVEIKHDQKFKKTGNLWIEVGEKARPRPGSYATSGICRNDNSWLYVIGDYDTIFIFAKSLLVGLHGSGRYPVRENRTKTSVGFLLPEDDARKYAANILTPNAASKMAESVADLGKASEMYRAIVDGDSAA